MRTQPRPIALFLGAYAALLHAYTDDTHPTIGLVSSTRDHPATEELIGYFLNILPLQVAVEEANLTSMIGTIERQLAEALTHRHVPFSSILRALRNGGPAAAPSALFVYADTHRPALDDLEIASAIRHNGTAVAPVTLFVRPDDLGWHLSLEYNGEHLSDKAAGQFLDRYLEMLLSLLGRSDDAVTDVRLQTPVDECCDPAPLLPPLPQIIADLATTQPDRPAIRCGSNAWTYGELIRRALRIGRALQLAGVDVGDRVAVVLPRSTDMVAAILGILFARAAYVPIDADYPEQRKQLILAAAGPTAVITNDALRSSITHPIVLRVNEILSVDSRPDTPPIASSLEDPAYVIFTSGSTGEPRGVEISHAQLAATTSARLEVYDKQPGSFLMVSGVGFDSSIVGLFWTLAVGGELVIPTDEQVHDVDQLGELIERTQPSHTLMVPSLYGSLLRRARRRLDSLQLVIVAGEACTPDVVRRHFGQIPWTELVNEYGPTEATVWSSFHRVEPADDPIPIGTAIAGVTLRVADPSGRAKPIGVAGELLIAGAGVAAGYINDVAATRERFVHIDSERWYRSGDLVRRREDGRLDYLGRVDDQLNLGGIRIEPTEIEAVIARMEGVGAVAVTASVSRASALIAHVESETATVPELQSHCETHLPRQLVPRRFELHAELPKTPNGKIDRAALRSSGSTHQASTSDTGSVVLRSAVQAWGRALAIDDAEPDTDFFDAGGDSLAAVELTELLEKALRKPIRIAEVVRARSPRTFVEQLDSNQLVDSLGRPALLETIRFGDDRAPLVVFDGAPGQPVGFAHMARALENDQPVVGFRLPGLDGAEPMLRSISDQATRMLHEVLELDDRPLTLMGLSTGGMLALELAQQLTARGRQPSLVVLVDTIYPGMQGLNDASPLANYQATASQGGHGTALYETARTIKAGLRDLKHRSEVIAHERTGRSLRSAPRRRQLNDIAHQAERRYKPHHYDGNVLFFSASSTPRNATTEPWSHLLPNMEVVEIPGHHHLIVKDPDLVSPLAKELDQRLGIRIERGEKPGSALHAYCTANQVTLLRPIRLSVAERVLIWALHHRRFSEAANELLRDSCTPDAAAVALRASTVQGQVDAVVSGERTQLTSQLASSGIDTRVDDRTEERLYPLVELRLEPSELDGAVSVLRTCGYEPWHDWQHGAWEFFKRVGSSMVLHRDEGELGIRVRLRWKPRPLPGPRRLRPTVKDLAWLQLPRSLAHAYYALRPVRLAVQRAGLANSPDAAPFLATPAELIRPMLAAADVGPDDVLVDLGSGDGRVLIEAVKLAGCRAIGIEHDERLATLARRAISDAGLDDRIEIRMDDATTADLSEATVVFAFLPAEVVTCVLPKILDSLSADARLVVHEQAPVAFPTPPDRSMPVIGENSATVAYFWRGQPSG